MKQRDDVVAVASAGPCIFHTLLQTDNHISTYHSVFTDQMLFLMPHQHYDNVRL